jgi:hypothetical protein
MDRLLLLLLLLLELLELEPLELEPLELEPLELEPLELEPLELLVPLAALKVQGATVQVQPVLAQAHVPVALAQLHGTLATAQLLLLLVASFMIEPLITFLCRSSIATRVFSMSNSGLSVGSVRAFMFLGIPAYKH